jgi:hypothetical protein
MLTDLTALERCLWEAIETGEPVSPLNGGTEKERDPKCGALWGPERTVRSEVLAEMLTGAQQPRKRPRAIRLAFARITGALNLEGLDLLCPLCLESCYFDESLNLEEARAPKLELIRCYLPSFDGRQLTTRGDVSLEETRTEAFLLEEACVGGRLQLSEAHLGSPTGVAFRADGARIEGDAFFYDIRTEGEVSLLGAHIGGQLILCGAHLKNPTGNAFSADGAEIEGGVFFDNARTEGDVRLLGAHIGGQLKLDGAHLKNPTGNAFSADGAEIGGDLFCDHTCTEGLVRLLGVHVGGVLKLAGAHLIAPIGDVFGADGPRLKNPDGDALNAKGAQIAESVFCVDLRTEGGLRLESAHIGGPLKLVGAHIKNPTGDALSADGVQIDGDVLCDRARTEGVLRLDAARIGGRLDLGGSALSNQYKEALYLCHATIKQLVLPMTVAPQGVLDLRHARVTHLADDWPNTTYTARIDDLAYETLSPVKNRAKDRLEWIAKAEGGFRPQPYEQLAAVLRRAGRDDDARRVAIVKETERRPELGFAGRAVSWFLGSTVAFGYKPGRGVLWLGMLAFIGWAIFGYANAHHDFIAVREGAQTIPQFHAWLYSLDCVLPVINLGQRSYWAPTGLALYWTTVSVVAGWILVTVILGAVTTRLIRN